MPTDPNLDKTLVMLDEAMDPDEQGDVSEAAALAERLGLPFDPVDVEFVEGIEG